jgi:thiol-disulfide isomerase/thioredoxin
MVGGMKKLAWLLVLVASVGLQASDGPDDSLEREVTAIVAGPQVTVVHFWAPWCPNCRAEMTPDGWARFIADNPETKFVFINIWHKGQDPRPRLQAAGLGSQGNLILRTHFNPSRLAADRLNIFLDLPVTWVPTTWVFRDGKLRVAFNYGEIRFPVLQQMMDDARNEWSH